jgi:hypothetical protein
MRRRIELVRSEGAIGRQVVDNVFRPQNGSTPDQRKHRDLDVVHGIRVVLPCEIHTLLPMDVETKIQLVLVIGDHRQLSLSLLHPSLLSRALDIHT